MTVVDTDGQITQANERAEDLLDLTESEIAARTYNDPEWDLVDKDGDPLPDDTHPLSQVLATGKPVFDVEVGAKGLDETTRWFSVHASPIRFGSDRIHSVVVVFTDITEDREQERAMQRHTERLEEFTHVVSHDLRNPLSIALGRLELAKEESPSEHLAAIERALRRMEELVEDLLILAREDEQILEVETVDLADTVRACWETVHTSEATLVTDTD